MIADEAPRSRGHGALLLNRVTAAQAVHEVVGVLRAGAEVASVLQTLLGQVRLMLEADEAYIALREGRSLRLAAAVGIADAPLGASLGGGLEAVAVSAGEPLVLLDASRHAAYRDFLGRGAAVGAYLACPMVSRGEVIGVVVATRRTPGRLGGSDLWWVELLGGLAAVVVEQERARAAQEHRARQAEVLLDVASLADADPKALLQRLAETLTRDLGVSRVDLLLREGEDGELACFGSSVASDRQCSAGPLPIEIGSALDAVLSSGQTRLWTDDQDDSRFPPSLRDAGARAALAAPIVVAGRRRGVLLLSSESPTAFDSGDEAFALVLAARAGLLLEESELRERRRELERFGAETKARQEFVGVISHELKTPVAVIQAYTDVLLRRAEKAGDTANLDVLRRVGEQVERMLHMVDQTLDLQRLEAGLLLLEVSRFDLAALVRRVAEEMASLTTQHRIAVTIAPDADPLLILADRRRVEEVIVNLLQNALKYSAGGEVAIGLRREQAADDERAIVAVRDEGVGIALDEQAHVFERFYQGQSRLFRGHVGLGLGLYISREIVRRHGGEIALESIRGEGTTFTFWLPVAGRDEAGG